MPELPEVENLRLGLLKYIKGQKILEVKVNKPKLVSSKSTKRKISKSKVSEFELGLVGEKFLNVERRAKNLIFKLTHDKYILAHLKMTGQFIYESKNKNKKIIGGHPIELSETTLPNKHTHIIFHLDNGTLYYNDTRMFGYVLYYPNTQSFEKENHFKKLGLELQDEKFTMQYFAKALENKKSKIKTILLNQDIVVGVGNIYADESLFEAKIAPTRIASSLTKSEITKLHKAIIRIIEKAISVGGSSVATYRLIDDTRGNYAREHKVYGKVGQKCVKCNHPLKKIIIGGRTTIFCPNCQK
jgi:formamidopyrimidine-DNA glycosylase